MRLIDKYIEWLVSVSIVLITTASFFYALVSNLDMRIVRIVINYFNVLILFLIFLYQKRAYGIRIYDRAFLSFYIVYCLYVLVYMTILRKYPLEDMLSVPKSIFNFFMEFMMSLFYFLCAKTIVIRFNMKYFFILSLIICTIPTLLFLQAVGVEAIQDGISRESDDYINKLIITYSNVPILVFAVVFFKRLFSKQILSKIVCSCVIAVEIYILLVYGKRGPILWSFMAIISFFAIKSHSFKIYFILGFVIFTIYMCMDPILNVIKDRWPKSGAKLEVALKEGDTSHRLDVDDAKHSTFLVGLENFSRSPILGYYFRLDSNELDMRGAYAHNVFIEVLMTMGLLGFVPFMILFLKAYRNIRFAFRHRYSNNQTACFLLFLCVFLQLQTKGTCVFKNSFWLYFYILCCLDKIGNIKKFSFVNKKNCYGK